METGQPESQEESDSRVDPIGLLGDRSARIKGRVMTAVWVHYLNYEDAGRCNK